LIKQKERMDGAFAKDQADRRARREGGAGALGKHPADAESSMDALKRAKIEPVEMLPVDILPATTTAPLVASTGREIDISPLPERVVIDMVIRGLEAISAEALAHILDVSSP
jgi:hypothetical protein